MAWSTGGARKKIMPGRITMLWGPVNATNNHPVRNLTELRVEQIKSNLRNKPRKEVAPVPAICPC